MSPSGRDAPRLRLRIKPPRPVLPKFASPTGRRQLCEGAKQMDTAHLNDGPANRRRGPSQRGLGLTRMQRRATASGTIGQALEYFDFAVYGALSATVFPQLFFSDLGESAAILASFATFG